MSCKSTTTAAEARSGLLDSSPWRKSDSVLERIASAWNTWAKTTVVTAIVCHPSWPVRQPHTATPNTSRPIRIPSQTICPPSPRANTPSEGLCGGRCIAPRSAGSTLMPRPSTPSVTRFSQRSWNGENSSGSPMSGAAKTASTLPRLPASENLMNFRMLS